MHSFKTFDGKRVEYYSLFEEYFDDYLSRKGGYIIIRRSCDDNIHTFHLGFVYVKFDITFESNGNITISHHTGFGIAITKTEITIHDGEIVDYEINIEESTIKIMLENGTSIKLEN